MLTQIEGSQAVAETVALCRPEVIPAYPISPQTHIVEGLSVLVKSGQLTPCEFINVESEFSAMSVAIGASAAGARTYTATASQGLLFMVEALYNASGLGLPIVMTVANRAIGAPINIWNDHSDSMSQRDSGWLQIYARSNQEAADMHVQAFKIAEELSIPVMVCMDGFLLTHAVEQVDLLEQEQVDAFLPPYEPRQVLDPDEPISIGAMVGPEAFTEVRYLANHVHMQALDLIPQVAEQFYEMFGRRSGGLVDSYRCDDAETIIVALGSVIGTVQDAVDTMREDGVKIGCAALLAMRPFPVLALKAALDGAKRIVVIEKNLAVGIGSQGGGVVSLNIRAALSDPTVPVYTVIAGLGGRPITASSLRRLMAEALADRLEHTTFLDLDQELVDRELERLAAKRRSGPLAENILKDVNVIASRQAPEGVSS